MKQIPFGVVAVRSVVVALVLVMLASACGSDDGGSIEVQDASYRLSREDRGAGYLTITNTTDETVTLEAASAEGVGSIELHESVAADDGTMSMQSRPDGFEIGAGETVSLEPGGKHLMIFDPSTEREDLTLNLDFGDETISVVAAFDEAASAAADSMDGMDHDDDSMDHDEDSMDHDADADGE